MPRPFSPLRAKPEWRLANCPDPTLHPPRNASGPRPLAVPAPAPLPSLAPPVAFPVRQPPPTTCHGKLSSALVRLAPKVPHVANRAGRECLSACVRARAREAGRLREGAMARQWRVSPSFRGANLALGSDLGQTTAFGTLLFFPPAKRPVTGPLRALLPSG